MFGQWPSISEAFPLYFLDYQERSADPDSQTRWLDRVVPDGSWSGNLYDFFRRVIRKLTADLKVPFLYCRAKPASTTRGLREALVNALIHADYGDRASILVVKQPAGFMFRNPDMMRVPVAQALHGGASDCRNRTLHQLFLLINLGERAGSGLPKIRAGWEAEGHVMHLSDTVEPFDKTVLEMETLGKMLGKTPERILAALRSTPSASIPELAALLEKSDSVIERAIRQLREQDRLRRVGPAKGGYWEVVE